MRIFRGILILITSVLLLACGGYYGEGYYGRPYPGYYPGHFYRHHLHDRGRLTPGMTSMTEKYITMACGRIITMARGYTIFTMARSTTTT